MSDQFQKLQNTRSLSTHMEYTRNGHATNEQSVLQAKYTLSDVKVGSISTVKNQGKGVK